ncbi:MAG: site-specific integrase [Clostridium sp.]|nr:site-specific integrase [Clostridium sp.]
MTSIKVKFRPSAVSSREGVIFYQIIHERKVRQLTTEYRVLPEEWDAARSMVKNANGMGRLPLIQDIRQGIRSDVERLARTARRLEERGGCHTVDDIIDQYRRFACEYSLFNFMEGQIVKLRRNGRIRTSETYAAALNSFRQFRKGEDVMMDSVSSDMMEAYSAWHKSKGNSSNTISFYLRVLRAAYNRVVEDGVIEDRRPFRRVFTGVEKTAKRALPLDVIRKIRNLDLSASPALDFARDMFMLSFLLRGMSFVDMAFLKKSDLKEGAISYRRRKTGQRLTIAWTEEMQKILGKYPTNTNQYLLPIISRAGCNERCAYKRMAEKINRGLKEVAKMAMAPDSLTMYVARHSWASAARAKGFPLSVISEGMGHENEATTRIYLASLETSVVDKANAAIIASL